MKTLGEIKQIYELLYARYGELYWWPTQGLTKPEYAHFEIMVGAVLTQNTAWTNVEKALINFGDALSPEYIDAIDIDELKKLINPAGFFNQKAVYLKSLTAWYKKYGYSIVAVQKHANEDFKSLRNELLSVRGIGRETADSILLYAFGLPTFVIDAYTMRLLTRLGILTEKKPYEAVKALFEVGLSKEVDKAELFNRYHALIVINAKEHCRTKPVCTTCPLEGYCDHANQSAVNEA